MYVSEICAKGIFCNISLVTKKCEKYVKNTRFQMSAILKFDFQKTKQLRFSEVNYLNYTKKTQFCMRKLVSLKQGGNKIKQWTHSTPVKLPG